MLSFFKRERNVDEDIPEDVPAQLKKIYKTKLLPLEERYGFHDFHLPKLEDADFESKPLVLLMGQYSTGKTTFIRHLLQRDFPGIRIGPEPTTDHFIYISYDQNENILPGNALVVDKSKPFNPLSKFGNAFLNRFKCSLSNSPVLESVSIIDTPGILSGQKQTVDRGYDFAGVLEWFAERVDRIILIFDANKLDISDELRRSIRALKGHDEKIRIILNKADLINPEQLMRVYGALMWSLSKVLQTPEVSRIYIGSFWDKPLRHETHRRLFEDDEHELFEDLKTLPRNATLRKFNDLMKRARLVKVHALIITELHKEMPPMFGKDRKKKDLLKNLEQIYKRIEQEYSIPPGDFPDISHMREILQRKDFSRFHSLKYSLITDIDDMVQKYIPQLIEMIPNEQISLLSKRTVMGGAFEGDLEGDLSPFGPLKNQGIYSGFGDHEWICLKDKPRTDGIFNSLGPVNAKLSGSSVRQEMMKSKLPSSVLSRIWKLADVDGDGFLDSDEFALAMHLIRIKVEGSELPITLPDHLIPPSKRCYS